MICFVIKQARDEDRLKIFTFENFQSLINQPIKIVYKIIAFEIDYFSYIWCKN